MKIDLTSENPIIQRIIDLMNAENISQSAMGRLLGITPQGVGQMLRSQNTPEHRHLSRISETYGCSLNYLYKGEGETPEPKAPLPTAGNVNTNKNNLTTGGSPEGSAEVLYLRRENESLRKEVQEWKEMYNKVLEKLLNK